MDKIVFAGEGEPIEYPLDTDSELLRNAQVSEWAHVSLEPEEALEILESAKKFRLAGKSVADYHFTEEEQAKLRTVLMLYREMLPKETF